MDIQIRAAAEKDIDGILTLVNTYAAQNLMLPRTPEQINLERAQSDVGAHLFSDRRRLCRRA